MDTTLTIDALVVTMLVGTILPILVGLVTKSTASSGLKGVALLFLSAVQGFVVNQTVADGSAVFTTEGVLLALLGFVAAVASYFGVLKPTGAAPAVQEKTSNFGIGH